MSEYMRSRRAVNSEGGGSGGGGEGFFCRFTFGQFFALLVLEVFTLFFVFYLGARYGRDLLGLGGQSDIAKTEVSDTAITPEAIIDAETGEPKVLTTSDPDAARLEKELLQKAKTPELKERISRMFENAKMGETGKVPEIEVTNRAEELVNRELAATKTEGPLENLNTPRSDTNYDVKVKTENPEPKLSDSAGSAQNTEPPIIRQAGEGIKRDNEGAEEVTTTAKTDASEEVKKSGTDKQATGMVRIKSSDSGKYSVQVGSYPKLGEANRALERWKTKGYPAYLMIADIPDRGKWYRVRIGGFGTRDDASKYLKEFQSREDIEALIVMNEQ